MVLELVAKQQLLSRIAAQASTPLERLQWGARLKPDPAVEHVQARLRRLYILVGASEEAMGRWFEQHGLQQAQLVTMFSTSSVAEDAALPCWLETLDQIVSAADLTAYAEDFSALDRCLVADEPIPFEELLLPFVRYARQGLASCLQNWPDMLSNAAYAGLERWLMVRLFTQAAQALHAEFSTFRARREPATQDWQARATQRTLYTAFVQHYSGEHLLQFFVQYSVLARLLVMIVEQWIQEGQEFLGRLAADRDELVRLFNAGQDMGPVTSIEAGLSDCHHDGRTVFLLTYATGLKLVYKPRGLDVDAAFFNLLAWINAAGLTPDLHVMRILNRGTYGWMEYIEHRPCQTRQEVERYYQRAGMLACLLYILGSTDMHRENLIACGEYPVVVDIETIMTPGRFVFATDELWSDRLVKGQGSRDFSVLDSGLLPGSMLMGEAIEAVDMSALGSVTEEETSTLVPRWVCINTDAMALRKETRELDLKANVVILNGTTMRATDYVKEVVAGFRSMYRFLLDQQVALLAEQGPLACFADCPVRFVFRATSIYVKLLVRLTHPKFLRDGADRWLELQVFEKPLLQHVTSQLHWAFIDAEQRSLAHMDVPFFVTRTASRDIWPDSGPEIAGVLAESALELVRDRVMSLSEHDMLRQIDFIRSAYISTLYLDSAGIELSLTTVKQAEAHEHPFDADAFVNVARTIARELEARAWQKADSVSWMGFKCYANGIVEKCQFQPVLADLYGGTIGIALFLTAFAQATGEDWPRDLVAAILQPLARYLSSRSVYQEAEHPQSIPLGGADGLGAWMYALTRLAVGWQRADWLDMARQTALFVTAPRVSQDEHFDVMHGSAGTLLGLLALWEVAPDEQLLERALVCGQHLVQQRVEVLNGARSWAGPHGRPLTGFSHGAAGIAYALLRLYEATGEQQFREAAEEAIAFEQYMFSPLARNWPDLRTIADPTCSGTVFATSWCHGAPGIGLARLGGLHVLNTPAICRDIDIALDTTLAYGLPRLDNLCCGNFGRLDFLVTAAQQLQRPQLLARARQQASTLMQRAAQGGGFRLLNALPRQAYNPGLFEGYAGVGYELLRLAYPERVPSLLLWR